MTNLLSSPVLPIVFPVAFRIKFLLLLFPLCRLHLPRGPLLMSEDSFNTFPLHLHGNWVHCLLHSGMNVRLSSGRVCCVMFRVHLEPQANCKFRSTFNKTVSLAKRMDPVFIPLPVRCSPSLHASPTFTFFP